MEIQTLHRYCNAGDRFELWAQFLADIDSRYVAEIGVYRGAFAAKILAAVPSIEKYFMVDPWRFIPSWNKPANTNDEIFQQFFAEALAVTEFASGKLQVLRGTTAEVKSQIPDNSLDFVYLDGDHTLKGITIDLICMFPKVKEGGWIAGDDFCNSIWQHDDKYEPTMVFPLATYFAEANGLILYALPYNQFAMRKHPEHYQFIDLTNSFGDTSVRRHVHKTDYPS